MGALKNPVKTPSTILGPPRGHFGFCMPCGIAGGVTLQVVSERPGTASRLVFPQFFVSFSETISSHVQIFSELWIPPWLPSLFRQVEEQVGCVQHYLYWSLHPPMSLRLCLIIGLAIGPLYIFCTTRGDANASIIPKLTINLMKSSSISSLISNIILSPTGGGGGHLAPGQCRSIEMVGYEDKLLIGWWAGGGGDLGT